MTEPTCKPTNLSILKRIDTRLRLNVDKRPRCLCGREFHHVGELRQNRCVKCKPYGGRSPGLRSYTPKELEELWHSLGELEPVLAPTKPARFTRTKRKA
jgi:hypothetical protein